MKIDKEAAIALKMAVRSLHDTQHGQLLLQFLDEHIGGRFVPTYDSTNTTSVLIATGRSEVIKIILNIDNLTWEQIVYEFNRQQGEE